PTLGEAESAFGGKKSSVSAPTYNFTSVKPSATSKASKAKTPPLSEQQITDMPFDIKIFTDGACEPNPGEAGTGLAVYLNNELTELWYGLYQATGTN
ncbi:ribonuclease HI, partial [Vibrio sp. 10N.222.49.E5]